jgi:hypothetical protein
MLAMTNRMYAPPAKGPVTFSSKRVPCPKCGARRGFAPLEEGSLGGKCHACGIFIPPALHEVPLLYPAEPQEKPVLIPRKFVSDTEVAESMRYITTLPRTKPVECTDKEERAAIVEFLAGFSQRDSEWLADVHGHRKMLRERHPFAATLAELTDRHILWEWKVGQSEDGATIFWYQDYDGRYRNGKKVWYNEEGFNRTKHNELKAPRFIYTQRQGYRTCLFGEYGLSQRQDVPVILVESEKTAIFMAYHHRDAVVVASGGANSLNKERAEVLNGRHVWIIFDNDLPGEDGAHKSAKILNKIGAHTHIITTQTVFPNVPSGFDPADYYYLKFKRTRDLRNYNSF